MASRTLNHLIEDESRQYFRSLLPKVWVYRDKTEDYGIDSEVEIFDKKGNPTGLVFWVQLKGTSSKDVKNIQNFTFKNEKLDQFRNYEIPVLIVRYSTFTNTLYARWAKSIFRLNREKKSTKVTFFDDSIWNDETPEQIINYLGRQTFIKQGKVRFPIKTFLKRRSSDLSSTVSYSNLVLVKNAIANYSNYFTLSSEEPDSLLQIIIENKQIVFSFTDLAFSSLGLNFDQTSYRLDDETVKFILITFSSSLFELARTDLGSSVFFTNDLFTIAKKSPTYFFHFVPHWEFRQN